MGWVACTANSHLSQFLRLQVPRARGRLMLCLVRTRVLVHRWLLSCCVLGCRRRRGSSLGLVTGTRIPFKTTLLPGLNQLPKAPPPKTITLGNRISILRDKNIWSITPHHTTTYFVYKSPKTTQWRQKTWVSMSSMLPLAQTLSSQPPESRIPVLQAERAWGEPPFHFPIVCPDSWSRVL